MEAFKEFKTPISKLKNGDIFEVEWPDGTKQHCRMTCDFALKGAKTITVGGIEKPKLTLSVQESVTVIGHFDLDPALAEATKKQFLQEKRRKAKQLKTK